MSKRLVGFINLTKCKQAKIFKNKAGDSCCNVVLWLNDTPDQWGNVASLQLQSGKDEPKVYIGNLKEPVAATAQTTSQPQEPQRNYADIQTAPEVDDLPF
jgi:hypothetical protein